MTRLGLLGLIFIGSHTAACAAEAASQNALAPAGPNAENVVHLWWSMAIGAAVIWGLVTTLACMALRRGRASRPAVARLFLIGGGVVLPVVTLTILLVYTLTVGRDLVAVPAEEPLRIHAVGKQWWWEIRYLGLGEGGTDLVSANEVHIPVGRPVEFILDTSDVIHSFWVPALAGKIDMIPGRTNRLRLSAERPGIYRGQCAEYCGLQHAWMALHVVAQEADAFEAWLQRERRDQPEPQLATLRTGRDAFLDWGCGACHTVRGTEAQGRLGPDLTHVGGRQALGAGVLANGVGPLAGWIAGSQTLKPGNRMPSFNELDGPTLRAIAAWLDSLK